MTEKLNEVHWKDVRPGDLWVYRFGSETWIALVVSLVETTKRGPTRFKTGCDTQYDVSLVTLYSDMTSNTRSTSVSSSRVNGTDCFGWSGDERALPIYVRCFDRA